MELAVFPVLDAGHTIATDGRRLPTVVIDAADVPAVADLARVHATDAVVDDAPTWLAVDLDGAALLQRLSEDGEIGGAVG